MHVFALSLRFSPLLFDRYHHHQVIELLILILVPCLLQWVFITRAERVRLMQWMFMVKLPSPILRVLSSRPTKIIEDSEDEGENSETEDDAAHPRNELSDGIKQICEAPNPPQPHASNLDEDNNEQVTPAVGRITNDEADDDSSDDGVVGGFMANKAIRPAGVKAVVPSMRNIAMFVVRRITLAGKGI